MSLLPGLVELHGSSCTEENYNAAATYLMGLSGYCNLTEAVTEEDSFALSVRRGKTKV
jgi:hypothetical protein